MNIVETLIDKWRATRSQRDLARRMGVTEHRLSAWKHGKLPMPEHQFAKLAELVEGEDVARSLLWDFVRQKRRHLADAVHEMSERFKRALLHANPRGDLLSVG